MAQKIYRRRRNKDEERYLRTIKEEIISAIAPSLTLKCALEPQSESELYSRHDPEFKGKNDSPFPVYSERIKRSKIVARVEKIAW
jgi:hypothetical protein